MANDVLNISTGTQQLEIRRDGVLTGECIDLNPTDTGWMERFYQLLKDLHESKDAINKRYDELSKIEGNDAMGIPNVMGPGLEYSREVIQDLRNKIDKVFGESTSQKVFGGTMKFEVIEQFFNGILPYIEAARKPMVEKYGPPQIKGKKHSRTLRPKIK
jgi:hypothetical protein